MKLSLFRFFSFVSLIPLFLVLMTYPFIPLMFALFNATGDFDVIFVPRIVIVLFGWLCPLVCFLRIRFSKYDNYVLKLMILEQSSLFLVFLILLFAGLGYDDYPIDGVVFILSMYVLFRSLLFFERDFRGFKKSVFRFVTRFNFNVTCFEVIILFIGFNWIKEDVILLSFTVLIIMIFGFLKLYFFRRIKNEVS